MPSQPISVTTTIPTAARRRTTTHELTAFGSSVIGLCMAIDAPLVPLMVHGLVFAFSSSGNFAKFAAIRRASSIEQLGELVFLVWGRLKSKFFCGRGQ